MDMEVERIIASASMVGLVKVGDEREESARRQYDPHEPPPAAQKPPTAPPAEEADRYDGSVTQQDSLGIYNDIAYHSATLIDRMLQRFHNNFFG